MPEDLLFEPSERRTFTFTAVGAPKAQPRGRAVRRGAHAGVYDPGTADGWKAILREASRPMKPAAALEGALSLILLFRFCRPGSHLRKDMTLTPKAPRQHVQKPDFDNLAKAVCDALSNEGWWRDDTQIVRAIVDKEWTTSPQHQGATVTISELG